MSATGFRTDRLRAPEPSEPTRAPRERRWPVGLGAVLLVLVAALMLYSQQHVPAATPASERASDFSAERALAHVRAISGEPRHLGSAAHERAREYLLARLRALGLRPRVQRTTVVNTFPGGEPAAGLVTNVIARLRGTASTGAIALNAHYDAAATGPGASDCGSCVGSVLETARALRAGPRLRNDVILVFSDGEENGDLGAAAFAGQHPWMRDIDAVVNFETAGSHGPSLLLATNSSWLVDHTLDASATTRAYSVLPSLFRGLFEGQQLATDTQEYMDRGAAGIQFGYLRGTTDYHTVLDNVDRLGRGSLQMDGDYALGLTRRLGGESLTRQITDRSAYFNVTGGIVARYGPAVTVVLMLAAVGLFAASLITGLRRRRLTFRGLVLGAVAFQVVVLVSTIAAVLAWIVLRRSVPDLRVLTLGSDQNAFFVFGLLAFALAVFGALYHPLLRRARSENLALGALTWWLVLTVAFSLAAPSAGYLFAWPALAALGVALWRLSGDRRSPWQTAAGVAAPIAVLVVVYAPVMLVFTLLALRLDGMGLPALGAMGLFATLAAGLLIPHLLPRLPGRTGLSGSRWLAPAVSLAVAIALVGIGVARLDYDRAYPRPDFLSYVLDADTGRASWQAGDRESWSAPLLRRAREADVELAPFATFAGWRAPAPAIRLPGPRLTVIDRSATGDVTRLRLRIASPRAADAIAIGLRTGPITTAVINRRQIPLTAKMRGGEFELPFVGVPRAGVELTLSLRGHGVLRSELRDWTQGLPDEVRRPRRPADSMPAPIAFRADPTVVVGRGRVSY